MNQAIQLFSEKKQVAVGTPGISSFFALRKVEIRDPVSIADKLQSLRTSLLRDLYFANVPSFQIENAKTAVMFHAKDDLPEVRKVVFDLLLKQDFRFYAVVRDKQVIAHKVIQRQRDQTSYRYHPNLLYDRCITRLFRDRLHSDSACQIYFAERGKSDRTEAFRHALEAAVEMPVRNMVLPLRRRLRF